MGSRIALLGYVLLAGLALTACRDAERPDAGGAQVPTQEVAQVPTQAITGEILAVTTMPRELTVKSANGEGVVYNVALSATIQKGSDSLLLEDLRVGWTVVLTEIDPNPGYGPITVRHIKVVKAP